MTLDEFRNHNYLDLRLFEGDQRIWIRNARHNGTQAYIWQGFKDGAIYAKTACHWAFEAFPELRCD